MKQSSLQYAYRSYLGYNRIHCLPPLYHQTKTRFVFSPPILVLPRQQNRRVQPPCPHQRLLLQAWVRLRSRLWTQLKLLPPLLLRPAFQQQLFLRLHLLAVLRNQSSSVQRNLFPYMQCLCPRSFLSFVNRIQVYIARYYCFVINLIIYAFDKHKFYFYCTVYNITTALRQEATGALWTCFGDLQEIGWCPAAGINRIV